MGFMRPEEFGRLLIETNDLDPVYNCVWESGLTGEVRDRWLMSYWCFYHMGTASALAGRVGFWEAMERAIPGTLYPRSSERRHFRGAAAERSVATFKEWGRSPTELIYGLTPQEGPATLGSVLSGVARWVGFGPWIGFKVADMLERLDIAPVRFGRDDVFKMFDAPVKGAVMLVEQYGSSGDQQLSVEEKCRWAYNYLMDSIGHLTAPPRRERSLGIQEIETVLCKWKSHVGGRYQPSNDTKEIHHGLLQYEKYPVACKMLEGGREAGLW